MHAGPGRYFITAILALFSIAGFSQEIAVRGAFVEDSLLIGQEVNYWIVAQYPPEIEMVFPDSTFDFAPFEWASKKYFPSTMVEGMAYDSTVFTIQSFEVDPLQYLQLTAFVLQGSDSVLLKTPLDSIFLKELAPTVSDTTSLKTNLEYQAVNSQFNFPLLYYILGGLAVVVFIGFLIFGRKIARYFKLKRLARQYRSFSEELDRYVSSLKQNPSSALAEEALTFWKKYQEKLDKVGFSTFTTKEILALAYTKELESPLRSIDRAIYGNRADDSLYQEFQLIENFAQDRYNLAYDRIKNNEEEETPSPQEQEVLKHTKISGFDITEEDLRSELSKGGRFVIFYYTISVVFMTFQRSSKVMFIKANENAFMKGIQYTIITILLGWWGIPWGIIRSFESLYHNLNGGKDVTGDILKN